MTTKVKETKSKVKNGERTPKEFVAGMKRSKKDLSQTQVVTSLMENYPELTPKDIQEITGIKCGTIYTIQSRLRSAHRKEHTKTADTPHMDKVGSINETMSPEAIGKQDLFNRLADVYLKKIEEAEDIEEASKYNTLLIQVMESLDK